MRIVRTAAVMALFCVVTVGAITGQDKPAAPKSRGVLPQNFSKLGLSDDQKTKVYDIQNKYRSKIEDLGKQIKELKDKEYKEQLDVLTADQKNKLKDILSAKAGITPETKK